MNTVNLSDKIGQFGTMKKCLNVSDYQHSKDDEAQVAREIYNKYGSSWEDVEKSKPRDVECRILMPMFIIENIAELKRKKKMQEVVGLFLPDAAPLLGMLV